MPELPLHPSHSFSSFRATSCSFPPLSLSPLFPSLPPSLPLSLSLPVLCTDVQIQGQHQLRIEAPDGWNFGLSLLLLRGCCMCTFVNRICHNACLTPFCSLACSTAEPASMDVMIDGTTDPCSRGEDINFQFTGFDVHGQVRAHTKQQPS